ncbi:DUF4097 family beta strand repeat-containing protein [Aerococcus viridans]|uniref:DUF4097 family beta strand repeat protein n=1 Tax=Aerococcus urinaeequi TaxID=51665 RepID=A0A7M1KRK6_9LACT|nr:DUF4097 family beta strand repeat-containing protein [Aerococcus urinaeequi]QGS37697.1 DUF4097 family beta strand repeat protein [Aerococcus viridans]QOQ78976.1 DUF4097 family beta strand repeat protein [Aerococcus urinaeequi]
MTNHKERILNLVKEGILTNEEAIILLENRAKQAESNPTTQKQVEEEKDILDDFYANWENDQAVNQDDITGRTQKVAIQKDLEASLASKLTERQNLVNQEGKSEVTHIEIDRLTEEINQLTEQIHQLKEDIIQIDAENPRPSKETAQAESKVDESQPIEEETEENAYDYKNIVGDFFTKTRSVLDQVQDKVSKTVKFEKGSGSIPIPKLITHDFEATYEYTEPLSMVDIQIAAGQIELTSWDQPTTKLTVVGKLYGDFDEEDAQTTFEKRANLEFVDGALNLNMISRFIKTDIVVQVPKDRLDFIKARTISGPVTVEDMDTNDIYIQTVDGAINIENFTASMIEVDTKNGQLTLNDVEALDLVVKSLNGSQRLKGHVENVLMETLNGDIVITMDAKPLVRAQVETKNGDIKLNMPAGTAVDGLAHTNQGEIMFRSDLIKSQSQVNDQFNKQKAFYHDVAEEKAYRVNLKTMRGNIRVKDDADMRRGEI